MKELNVCYLPEKARITAKMKAKIALMDCEFILIEFDGFDLTCCKMFVVDSTVVGLIVIHYQ